MKWKCSLCNKIFDKKGKLGYHLLNEHGKKIAIYKGSKKNYERIY